MSMGAIEGVEIVVATRGIALCPSSKPRVAIGISWQVAAVHLSRGLTRLIAAALHSQPSAIGLGLLLAQIPSEHSEGGAKCRLCSNLRPLSLFRNSWETFPLGSEAADNGRQIHGNAAKNRQGNNPMTAPIQLASESTVQESFEEFSI